MGYRIIKFLRIQQKILWVEMIYKQVLIKNAFIIKIKFKYLMPIFWVNKSRASKIWFSINKVIHQNCLIYYIQITLIHKLKELTINRTTLLIYQMINKQLHLHRVLRLFTLSLIDFAYFSYMLDYFI